MTHFGYSINLTVSKLATDVGTLQHLYARDVSTWLRFGQQVGLYKTVLPVFLAALQMRLLSEVNQAQENNARAHVYSTTNQGIQQGTWFNPTTPLFLTLSMSLQFVE